MSPDAVSVPLCRSVVYLSDKHAEKASTIASKRLLTLAGVSYTQFRPKMSKIVIDFTAVEGETAAVSSSSSDSGLDTES